TKSGGGNEEQAVATNPALAYATYFSPAPCGNVVVSLISSSNDPQNGSCGATNNACNVGSLSDTTDSAGQYLWSCNGLYGGSNASCSIDKLSPPSITTSGGFLTCNANSYTFNWSAVSGASFYGAHVLDDTVRPSGAADCTYGTDICVGDSTIGTSYSVLSTSQSSTCGILAVGASLTPGQSITSCNGGFRFTLQTDGNAVVYNSANAALWSSGTNGKASAFMAMQGDGNLVIYTASNGYIWGTANGHGGHTGTPTGLYMQGDGNAVIYATNGTVLWQSGTGSHSVTSLQVGHTYEARAYAYNGAWSAGSNTISFTVPSALACTSLAGQNPTGLTVGAVGSSCGRPIQTSWTALTGATGYYIYRSSDGTNYSQIASTTLTSYSDPNVSLNPGTYYYKIAAYNAAGTSNQTSAKSIDNSSGCSCTGPDGSSMANGSNRNFYSASTSMNCSLLVKNISCTNGILSDTSGNYKYNYCSPLTVVPVTINSFSISPSNTINLGGTCSPTWILSQSDSQSVCELYRSTDTTPIKTDHPNGVYSFTDSFSDNNVKNETTYKLSCYELDPVSGNKSDISTKYTTCNINPSQKETN
ncbi:MAG: hypothetical protein WCO18_02340, partial [bacterium]